MLIQCRQGSTAVTDKTATKMNQIDFMTTCRTQKTLTVRRQLEQGTYNLDSRLDAILETFLMDLSS